MKKIILAVCAAVGATVAFAAPAHSTTTTIVASWQMNEASGSTVLVDSGPNHMNGTIGTSITLNGAYQSFPTIKRGDFGTVDPQHVDTIYGDALNPGTADFIVTMRVKIAKPSDAFGNIMQKGQTGTPGGFWKVELDGPTRGLVFCGFRSIVNGVTTNGGIRSPINIADNQWHVVSCERGPGFVRTTVDGQATTQINHTTGAIVNNQPLSIGGKHTCSATHQHDCDYLIGQLDYVTISTQS
jgi:hypothetical protein